MSSILGAGRMDAGFHIALQEAQPQIDALSDRIAAPQAIELATRLATTLTPAQLPQGLEPLRRNASRERPVAAEECVRLINDYPHLALVRLSRVLSDAAQVQHDAIATANANLSVLDEVAATLAPAGPQTAPAPSRGPRTR